MLSPELAAAYEQLEAAVDALVTARRAFDPGVMLSGYTLIVSGIGFDDDPEPGADEQESVSSVCVFVKRGQSPLMTRGMVETFIDRLRSA
ncbi:hypothetical protein I5J47_gp11 [Mycobacterium phage Arib1]|uniref:Uncharacterized protein n=18 Tax=Pclasvirinae TaxID=1982878 RepID=A0A0K1Y627_9CAUD|nr:hypothetical protein PBI_FISHBURNE_11 [Mycobacterium phage Fishburne]YP_009004382.1 hypothetical protein PBI_DONOVAN_11 [Mycobacterium phage Donovan]YP_009125966.1 hypothetical protein MALITHI_11 [Mycobacterium phage Malithi]YP_009193908.1 hypothetical protein SEA_BRUSACORAM_11 [Mycobacterium phage Brusacoram]YP_009604794.1 hypothetical protein FDH94_gp11 [Mycobacterium phage Jebeks]YP_009964186.1 hypothetical protein I5J38_gp11 [Mycobacterium phage Willsammy]YP_009964266.1 hypothetical pr